MIDYEPWLIQGKTPFRDEDFWALPWREAERFTQWFIASIPSRTRALEMLIQRSPELSQWRADLSRESLVPLGSWVVRLLDRRVPNDDDIQAMGGSEILNPELPKYIVDDLKGRPSKAPWVYVDRDAAYSILADIGTYLGECVRAVGPRCRWARCKDKRDTHQNLPLLLWPYEKSVGFSPIGSGIAIASKIIDGRKPPELYAIAFDEMIPLATFQKPIFEPVIKRSGDPINTRCPQCGFGFARVAVLEGSYCNHCGALERSVR